MSRNLENIEKISISSRDFEGVVALLIEKGNSKLHSAIALLTMDVNREIMKLRSSPSDLTLASLTVRNIFEIYLISKHIYSNDKALYIWYGQIYKDFTEINDAIITLATKKGIDTSELEAIQKLNDETLEKSPFESEGAFNIRSLAETYGHLDDYKFIYKLCSKLVHPSSMKIMLFETLTKNDFYLNIVLHTGVYFTQEFSNILRSVIHENA